MAFSSLPPEILAMILSYLPIRQSLIAVGLSSSVLADFIFESLSFAQRHYLHQRQTTGASSIWHFMRSEGLVWEEWKSLPLSYQAALYRELLHADQTKKEEQFLNLFNGQVWNLGPTKALKIMQSLISEKAVSPSCQSNRAIHWAVINGHVEVVKLLLLENTLDFSQYNDEDHILLEAVRFGHVETVKVLLNDPRINPTRRVANVAFRYACHKGNLDIVKMLLAIPSVDPSIRGNVAIKIASWMCHEEVVALLLAHPLVVSNGSLSFGGMKSFTARN